MTMAELRRLHSRCVREMSLTGLVGRFEAAYAALYMAPLRRIYAWAIPCDRALDALAHVAQPAGVVEIGAGTGLWASLLRARGVRVQAYDAAPLEPEARPNWQHALQRDARWCMPPPFTRVDEGDAGAAAGVRCSALMLCWPPCEVDETAPAHVRSMAADAIAAFDGAHVALVVDSPWVDGGNAGSQAAGPSALQALHAGGFARAEAIPLPSWPSVPAELQIWSRVPPGEEPSRAAHQAGSADAAAPSVEEQDARRAQRAALVDGCQQDLDELLSGAILLGRGSLQRGERLVLARRRRRVHDSGSLAARAALGFALLLRRMRS